MEIRVRRRAWGKMNVELRSADTKKWSPRRKAAVVVVVRGGGLTREEAYERYRLSREELAAWEAAFARRGILGLRSGVR